MYENDLRSIHLPQSYFGYAIYDVKFNGIEKFSKADFSNIVFQPKIGDVGNYQIEIIFN